MSERYSHLIEVLGQETFDKIQSSKILVVGAGGIGCELLKNLVLTGFKNIDIIDLDTIDISNLNRQFLFRKQHIGMSKAKIAKESVMKYNELVNITAYHGDIKSSEFGSEFFKKFDLVMNALDNISARRHVNRLCLSVEVPMIESGTAGYLGQVSVIKKGVTECFECQPIATPKQFAVCTIRSNPSAPIHCIVWAKMLFGKLYGPKEDGNSEDNSITDMDNNVISGTEELGNIVRDEQLSVEKEKGFKNWVFHKIFHTDIATLVNMPDLWKDKTPPTPLNLEEILKSEEITSADKQGDQLIYMLEDQKQWSFKESVEVFCDVVEKLKKQQEQSGGTPMTWDKDDELALSFVCSASNIRSHIFGIPMKSRFDVKSMAGNIIPAIATTNAVIGGLIVMEAIKVVDGRFNDCHSTYLYSTPSGKRLLMPVQLEPQNPKCFVCNRSFITVRLNTEKVTVAQFIDSVLKKTLAVNEAILTVGNDIIYEGGDQDLSKDEIEQRSKIEKKTLANHRLTDDSSVVVEDYNQDFKITINIKHTTDFDEDVKKQKKQQKQQEDEKNGKVATTEKEKEKEKEKEEDDKFFEIIGKTDPVSTTSTSTTDNSTEDDDDDGLEIIEENGLSSPQRLTTTVPISNVISSNNKKRKEMESTTDQDGDDEIIELTNNSGEEQPSDNKKLKITQ